ncbi:MAG TPA: monooxygenase, partial [Chromatiales bacterium]|nr:monooxygenase [Chromatiales bacterium]
FLIKFFTLHQRATGIRENNAGRIRVETAQGIPTEADILIGADGLHSVVRPHLNGVHAPFFTGQVAWRAIVPAGGNLAPEATVYMGPGRHLVTYPLREGREINVVAVEERREWAAEGWNHTDDPDKMRAAFASFCPEVRSLLDRADEARLWGLFRHQVAPVWQRGRVAILGDAAHPTLPFLAQGAVMALEDAWVLADSLDRAGTVGDGLAKYQSRREARAKRVVDAATGNARNYHLRFVPLRLAAHTALRLASVLAPGFALRRFDWLYGYDVTRDGD